MPLFRLLWLLFLLAMDRGEVMAGDLSFLSLFFRLERLWLDLDSPEMDNLPISRIPMTMIVRLLLEKAK